jgi:hypothetical protein
MRSRQMRVESGRADGPLMRGDLATGMESPRGLASDFPPSLPSVTGVESPRAQKLAHRAVRRGVWSRQTSSWHEIGPARAFVAPRVRRIMSRRSGVWSRVALRLGNSRP